MRSGGGLPPFENGENNDLETSAEFLLVKHLSKQPRNVFRRIFEGAASKRPEDKRIVPFEQGNPENGADFAHRCLGIRRAQRVRCNQPGIAERGTGDDIEVAGLFQQRVILRFHIPEKPDPSAG